MVAVLATTGVLPTVKETRPGCSPVSAVAEPDARANQPCRLIPNRGLTAEAVWQAMTLGWRPMWVGLVILSLG